MSKFFTHGSVHICFMHEILYPAHRTEYESSNMASYNYSELCFLDVPKLPPLPGLREELSDLPNEEESKSEDKPERVRKTSGPRAIDPYASDESSLLLPVLITLGVFIPTLFCLCKL